MSTYRLDLHFLDDRKRQLPHAPMAHVCVKAYGTMADGQPLITSECVTFSELDFEINQLISELETIRKKARQRFADDDKRQFERAKAKE